MISLDDDFVNVCLGTVVKQYFINSNFEYMLPLLYKLKSNLNNRKVILDATEYTPLVIAPFLSVVDTIVDILEIPKEQIILRTVNKDVTHNRVTVEIVEDHERHINFPLLVVQAVSKIQSEFTLESSPVLFGALFGRCSYPRTILAHYLETNHSKRSYVTFLTEIWNLENHIVGFEDHYTEILEWARNRVNPDASADAQDGLGTLNFPAQIYSWPQVWGKYFIEIIVETDYTNPYIFTEKTWKCLASGKPFIIMAGKGSCKNLQDAGFKTYSPYINEDYDLATNPWERLELVKKEIDRLANLDQSQQQELIHNINKIAKHNINVCKEKFL